MKENLIEYLKKYKPQDNEIVKDNMIYCKNCGDQKLYVVSPNEFYVCRTCLCKERENEEIEKQKNREKLLNYYKTLKEESLLYENLKTLKFSDIDKNREESFLKAYNLCEEFCLKSKEKIKNGDGIYLYGDTGLGKTMLTACIANYCLREFIPTLFTSFFDIVNVILAIINNKIDENKEQYINKISNIPLLIIDDFGTELKTKNNDFLNEIVFQVLDKRVKNRKSTIFSSNFGLKELVQKGLTKKNAERILELCKKNFVKIAGQSYRLNFIK